MLKETDLENVKDALIEIAYACPIEPIKGLPLCVHPLTNTTFVMHKTKDGSEMIDITDEENLYIWLNEMRDVIRRQKDCYDVYNMVLQNYKLTFLKFAGDYLSKHDFSVLLADAWTTQENPNMDVNCNIRSIIHWFKKADKKVLMDEEDYAVYSSLPDTFTVYRGVSIGRTPKGLSWTRNKETAEWFMHRFEDLEPNKRGYMLKAEIKKENVLAYLNTRDEDEIVVDYYAIEDKIEKIS